MAIMNIKTDQLVYHAIQDEFEVTIGPLQQIIAVNSVKLNTRLISSAPASHVFLMDAKWSRDGQEYSHYQDLQFTLDNIGDVKQLWLMVKVRMTGFPADGFTEVVDSLDIDYDSNVPMQGDPMSSVCACVQDLVCGVATYNPYDLGSAVCFYQELNMLINEQFGLPTDYYKLDPEYGSGDVILREYTLYNTRDMQRMNMVVPRNEFPENRLTWSIEGSEYEQGFEVQVDKGYYEKYMGPDAHPRKNDIIHFLINDRIYEIRSVFLFRDFMQQGMFYKIVLQKYQPKSQTKAPKSEESRQSIEQSIISSEDLFGDEIRGEIKDITKASQEPTTMTRDLVRVLSHTDCIIPVKQTFNYTKIADGYYDLSKAIGGVAYKRDMTLENGESCTVSFWYKTSVDLDSDVIVSSVNGYPKSTTSSVHLKVARLTGTITFDEFSVDYGHEHGQWYACVLDMSNDFLEVGVEIFRANNDTRTLDSVKSASAPVTCEISFHGTISLQQCNLNLTSLRVTKQLVQERDRRLFLMQYNVAQARKAIIIDNVAEILLTESYSRPK